MYKVIQCNHYDQYGTCDNTVYYILHVSKFLFWDCSGYVTYWAHYDNSCRRERLSFSTEVEALKFIKEILYPGKPYDCFVYTEKSSI